MSSITLYGVLNDLFLRVNSNGINQIKTVGSEFGYRTVRWRFPDSRSRTIFKYIYIFYSDSIIPLYLHYVKMTLVKG